MARQPQRLLQPADGRYSDVAHGAQGWRGAAGDDDRGSDMRHAGADGVGSVPRGGRMDRLSAQRRRDGQ